MWRFPSSVQDVCQLKLIIVQVVTWKDSLLWLMSHNCGVPDAKTFVTEVNDWHHMWYRRDKHVLTVVCFWEGAGDSLCEKLRDRCHSKLVRRLLRKCDNNLHFLLNSHHWPGKPTTKQASVTVTGYLQGCLTYKWGSAFRGLNCRYLNTYIKLKLIELAILKK